MHEDIVIHLHQFNVAGKNTCLLTMNYHIKEVKFEWNISWTNFICMNVHCYDKKNITVRNKVDIWIYIEIMTFSLRYMYIYSCIIYFYISLYVYIFTYKWHII